MASENDPMLYKAISDKCLQLMKNRPSRSANYDDISNCLTQAMELFLTQFGKNCVNILDDFQKENKKFENIMSQCQNQRFIAELIVERNERFRIGSSSQFVKVDSYRHFIDRKERTIKVPQYSYRYKIDELKALTNVGKLCESDTANKPKAFYMDMIRDVDIPFECEKKFITLQNIDKKVFVAGRGSAFWACLSPSVYEGRVNYTSQSLNPEIYTFDNSDKNIQTLQKNIEKNRFNMNVIQEVIQRSAEVDKDSTETKQSNPSFLAPASMSQIDDVSFDSTSNTLSSRDLFSKSALDTTMSHQSSEVAEYADLSSSSHENLPPPPPDGPPSPTTLYKVKALYPYKGKTESELSFNEGDVIRVTEEHSDGWNFGELNGKSGFFPQNYVTKI
ncbi:Unconventional myosin-Ie [Thelohanellus kitauei]|uniref:Unconventional myosin-Ie n=1 Tax=Thelohanellus kitauei TaxID=669202 RepID=A0A0C2N669_THEKT|nr:Unconventional myosin-Ie [Thelohanellus kitauei]